jgi:hypothetical protein
MSKRPSSAKPRLPLTPTPTPDTEANAIAERDFVRLEKNLATIGYFTPTKGKGKSEVREKTVLIKRQVGDKTVVASATILPVARYGLPTTADQDKYLAFQKIVNDLRLREGMQSGKLQFGRTAADPRDQQGREQLRGNLLVAGPHVGHHNSV